MPATASLRPRHVAGVPLTSLCDPASLVAGDAAGVVVTNIAVEADQVRPSGLFAALPGRNTHGALHRAEARAAGAVAVLTDPAGTALLPRGDLPVLVTDDPRALLGRLSARVSGGAHERLQLFGVTGTNGKTSTVHLVEGMLDQLGTPAGHSSTVSRRSGPTTVVSRLTSPEAPELHALLGRMVEDGMQAAVLEVSAQALTHRRVDGLVFDVVGFTNLSHDHQDEYASMDDYLAAKLALFSPDRARSGVVLLDSPAGREVRRLSRIPVTTVTTLPDVPSDWRVDVVETTACRTRFTLTGPDGRRLQTSIPLPGRHLAADAALGLVMLIDAGRDLEQLASVLAEGIEASIPGRMERQSGATGPLFFTDFSHTPDSVATALSAVRAVVPGRVVVIIGADGEKDPTKRVPMGRAAAEGSDVVIVTDHHPRHEDPTTIRRSLLDGARGVRSRDVLEIAEPDQAVRAAVDLADDGDAILWVGPGHIDYRIVQDAEIPYSPRRDARVALAEAGW